MKGFKLEERSIVVRRWAVRARVVRGETFNMMVIMTFQINLVRFRLDVVKR